MHSTPTNNADQGDDGYASAAHSPQWVEKDGDVVNENLEEVLPHSEPADGPAPSP